MSLQVFYTAKGLALAAKIAAGTKLTVTKVTAGSGTTVEKASALAQEQQTLTVGTAQVRGQTATLPVTLAEVNAAASYTLTELGVYARDPDAGEILYQAIRLDEPRSITAGGENVCRFYLNQTIGKEGITVTCSPAGLLVDEDLAPVRDRVMAGRMRTVNVTLSPAELPGYIAALPRLLCENIRINVTAGVCTEPLRLNYFHGLGYLAISGAADLASVFAGGLEVEQSCVEIRLTGLSISGAVGESTVSATAAGYLYLQDCAVNGGSETYAVSCYDASHVAFRGGSVMDCASGYAVLCGYNSISVFADCAMSGNNLGAYIYHGGIVLLAGSTPDTLGGSSNKKIGGIIVNANGALL